MNVGSIANHTAQIAQLKENDNNGTASPSTFLSFLSDVALTEKTVEPDRSFEEMWKSRYSGAKYHVMDMSGISQGAWERSDFPYEKFFDDEVDGDVLNWQPSGKDPAMADALVQSRLDSTLGKKAIVVPPKLVEKMEKDPELAKRVMEKVESFIQNHPTRPGRILSYLISLNEEGDIAHFRVTGGGGHISGPSKAEMRQFEEEQKAKREKKIEERREAEKRAEERAREHAMQMERIFHRQNVEEAMLALQMQAFGRYYSGISDIPSSLPLSYATSVAESAIRGY